MTTPNSGCKYPKPKILLVDLPDSVTTQLITAGFNVRSGSFGHPYKVPVADNYVPVIAKAELPNHTEQEVIIIDLQPPPVAEGPAREKEVSEGELDWYASASQGVVDPRTRIMSMVRRNWDRILSSGGAFVVFAQPRDQKKLLQARARFRSLTDEKEIYSDNWSFLSVLSGDNIEFRYDHGTESDVQKSIDFLEGFLRKHQTDLECDTVIVPRNPFFDGHSVDFIDLWHNKFGSCIAGILVDPTGKMGRILILPQLTDKQSAVYDLVTSILPEISRHLFPDFAGERWVHGPEYEHPSVIAKKAVQTKITEEAQAKVEALNQEIEAERKKQGFIHKILTGTGEDLVAAVKSVLAFIGFQRVNAPEEEASVNKQEDLQIHDRSPTLLMEVKGLAGQPNEKDTLQGTKYVLRRVKEWNRTDVSGVFLVNHQRNLPALQRDHGNVFTAQQLADAEHNGMGLMTTWDLFRLIRGMITWQWPVKAVQDVFYGKGRLASLPSHYRDLGKLAHFYGEASVISIDLEHGCLKVGDTVGYFFEGGFFEEKIVSLQVGKKAINEAAIGERAGYKTSLTRRDIPAGARIYLVQPSGT